MKKLKSSIAIIALIASLPMLAVAGTPPVTKWTVKNPFEQKIFIENKGQYAAIQDKVAGNDILFGARQGGLQYYFTAHSIWIKKDVSVKRTDDDIEQMGEDGGGIDADDPSSYKTVEEYHQMEFTGANPSAQITTGEEVSWYYNFTIGKNVPVVAHAYKKLTYLGLYPGIDMEFYFPEDKQGFEYSFIVHPGADISQIKIQYPLNEGMELNAMGNVVIHSAFGDFTDHAPVASQSSKSVGSSFVSSDGVTVQFNVNNYDNTRDLVIDPWTNTPTFSGTNSAYDVDWDNDGNCYAYGGSAPWQLIKFNSSGVMQWSFTEDFTSVNPYYGGFAVDRGSRSAYLVEGFNSPNGAGIIKLNSSGAQIVLLPSDSSFREMWRIAFSRCTNQAVIAGGGTSRPSYQVCYLDTDLTSLSPVNVLNNTQECCHDMWGIALDNFGNCYTATVTTLSGADFENIILKLPLPSLTPPSWSISDGYNFHEAQSVDFAYGQSSSGNGFNGMTVGDSNLYSYDSYILKKWNIQTGALVSSATVNTALFNNTMHWGGLTSNDCGDIFLGSINKIIHYSTDLAPLDTTPVTDTVFDVKLGRGNILYTCGVGFISALQVNVASCGLDVTVTNKVTDATCNTPASVVVTPSGGTPPYTISWNTPTLQTGPVLTNVEAGTYVATIVDNSCSGQGTVLDTVTVTSPGSSIMYIPSAFTPSVIGVNDVFKPNLYCDSYTGYEMRIYNRWGAMVFQSNSADIGWNGTFNGQPLPMDVYVYYVKFTCGTCNAFKKGDVTLIR